MRAATGDLVTRSVDAGFAEEAELRRLADQLFEGARRGSIDGTLSSPSNDLDVALRVQLAVLDRWRAAGERLGGWKSGLTSRAARDMLGKGFRPFGFILESRILPSGAHLKRSAIGRCKVEAELCVIMKTPLRGAVDPDAARAAVGAIAPAFEINELRFPSFPAPFLLLADNLAQWGAVVGRPCALPPTRLVDTTVELILDGKVVEVATPGDTMDDPFVALARLATTLDRFGLGLEAGPRVITGAFADVVVPGACTVTARFGDWGEVAITFDDA